MPGKSKTPQDGPAITDETLVDGDMIRRALDRRRTTQNVQEYLRIEAEPVLTQYLSGELLKVCGKLALAGVGPEIVQGMACDVYLLVGVANEAMRQGYRALVDGLLPSKERLGDAPCT